MLKNYLRPLLGASFLALLITLLAEVMLAVSFQNALIPTSIEELIDLLTGFMNNSFFPVAQILCVGVFLVAAIFLFKTMAGKATYEEAADHGAHGTARFAKAHEVLNDVNFVKKTWNKSPTENLKNPSGLIFGLFEGKPLILHEETKIPNRNVFVVGSPGSGKTQSYILTNIIHERERSIVVTDPKGEIYEATANLKSQQGYEVRLINFKEMSISDRYNPIDYVTKEIEAEQVANTIVVNAMGDQKPDFWTKAEVALLKTLILYVKYEFSTEPTLAKVKEILTVHGATPEDMDDYFSRLGTDHPAYQSYLIVRMAEERVRASIFISLGVTLSKFDPKDVRRFTECSDFRLDDIGKKKMILYIILPVADNTWEPLISTFFSQMFQRLYDVADRNFNKLPVKVNLLLDEFPNLGKIPNYEEILATCRSYGISASTIVQSINQLMDKYSKEKAEAIVGNCSLRFILGVGDKTTAEYFSELLGKTTVKTDGTSVDKKGGGSTSFSYQQRNLLTPDELTRLPLGEAILFVSGSFAIKVQKTYQYLFYKGILQPSNQTSRFDYLKVYGSRSTTDMPAPQIASSNSPSLDSHSIESQIDLDGFLPVVEESNTSASDSSSRSSAKFEELQKGIQSLGEEIKQASDQIKSVKMTMEAEDDLDAMLDKILNG